MRVGTVESDERQFDSVTLKCIVGKQKHVSAAPCAGTETLQFTRNSDKSRVTCELQYTEGLVVLVQTEERPN